MIARFFGAISDRALLAVGLCLLAYGGFVVADNPGADYKADSVRFSIAEVPPWGYVDEQGEPAGMLVTLVQDLAEHLSEPIDYRLRPTQRTISELRQGEADFSVLFDAPGVAPVGERLDQVVRMRVLVVGLSEQSQLDGLNALTGQYVGYIRGAWYGEDFHSHEDLKLVAVSDARHGFNLLQRGRIKALVVTEFAAGDALLDASADKLRIVLELPEVSGSVYLSHRSRHSALGQELREAINSLRESGRLDEIFPRRALPVSD